MLRLLSIPFRFWSFRAFSWLFLLLSLSAVISCPKSQGSMRDFRLFPKREHCVPCLHAEALGNQTWSAAMQIWLFPIFYLGQLQGASEYPVSLIKLLRFSLSRSDVGEFWTERWIALHCGYCSGSNGDELFFPDTMARQCPVAWPSHFQTVQAPLM